MVNKFKQKIYDGGQLTFEEGLKLSEVNDKEKLYQAADEIRHHFCGDKMDLCSITNAKSGRCPEDCKWCSQSAFYKTNIEIYDIVNKERAIAEAEKSAASGVNRHSLVISGKKVSEKTFNQLIELYTEIKRRCSISLCASMGLINTSQLLKLKEIGIGHYHCNLETAPSFFQNVCTTHTIDEKINTIKEVQRIGLKACSGGIIGMGESMAQRIELACLLRDLNILSIPINILTPIGGTPLENQNDLTETEILTTIAVFRFINPHAYLRFAGGRMKIKHFQKKALRAGINAALTGNYLTTTGSDIQDDIKEFTASGFTIGK